MKFFGNWTTMFLSILLVVLPWQTRWIFGEVMIGGEHTEFGIMSVYLWEVFGIFVVGLGMFLDARLAKNPSKISIKPVYQWPIRWGMVMMVIITLGAVFAERSVFALASLLHLFIAFLFFAVLLCEHIRVKPLLLALVVGVLPPIFLGFFQVFFGSSPANTWLGLAVRDAAHLGDAVFVIHGERVLRAYGSFSHPNIFAGFLGVGLFFWWAIMAACRRYIWYGWVATFGTGLLLAGLLSTGSRSAVLGVCIGLIVITFIKALGLGRFARPIAMGMSVVLILGSFIASFLFTDIVAEIRGGGLHEERAMTERVQLYRDFVPLMLVTDPWFGCGFGTYALASADVFPEKNIYAYQPVHNIFLLIFAEVGVFGVLVVGAFLTSVVRANVARFPQHFSLYAFGALNVLATVAWYDHYLWSSWAGLVLVVIVLAMALRLGEE